MESRAKVVYITYDRPEHQPLGWYEESNDTVYIRTGLSLDSRKLLLTHELKHRECCKSKCCCWNKASVYWAEYHAMRAELDSVLVDRAVAEDSYVEIIRVYYDLIKKAAYANTHCRALEKVMRLKRFKALKRRVERAKRA